MDKTKQEISEADIKHETLCELHGYPIVFPGKAKYKISKDKYKKSPNELKPHPDIEVGKKAVLSYDEGTDRIGYYLAVLVDWTDEEMGQYWTYDTELFFIVLDRSNDKLRDLKGRIVSATAGGRWYQYHLRINSWDISTFKKV